MRQSWKVLLLVILATIPFSGFSGIEVGAKENNSTENQIETTAEDDQKAKTGQVIYKYASLPELVEKVCIEAMDHFYNFFGPGTVDVLPLEVVGELPGRRITMFGVTIADQMAARVSNDSVSKLVMDGADQQQYIMGALQEMDGFLRIHIYGVNVRGERRSYVVNVEMSDLLYRALHTYFTA